MRALPAASDARPAQAQAPKPARHGFIDLLRGAALVIMIETHIVNAYLPAGARQSATFFWLTFFNGLVAPAFLFASGFSLMLQANRHWEDWLHFRLPFWKQMRRLGFITLVAYYSHIDDFKLSRFLNPEDPSVWRTALQADVLQCIVASLLVVNGLILLLRRRSAVAAAAGLLGCAVALATPFVWSIDFTGTLPLALALFMNPHGISFFPLFPWICFVLAGSFACHHFLRSIETGRQGTYIRVALAAGVLMIAAGLAGRELPFTLPGIRNYFTTSPLYVLLRLGCVLIVCALLLVFERSGRRMPGWIRLAGQESLLVYGAHLWVIYGLLRGKQLAPILGLEAGYARCFAVSAGMTVAMLLLAEGWHRLKKSFPRFTKISQAAVVLTLVLVFLLR